MSLVVLTKLVNAGLRRGSVPSMPYIGDDTFKALCWPPEALILVVLFNQFVVVLTTVKNRIRATNF
ncbi:hypothetical protein WCN91_08930 [Pseudoalteromonas sp. YIC-827]|uniref:Uncharacterized protein n=1 Tax=Pseudoalteromonas qingdaonensis TaxID=3131913 RepID=A0ABU9MW85_9GAMM